MNGKTHPPRIQRATLSATAFTIFALAGIAHAQMGSGFPPPTYDWDSTVPGTQPPTSPLLANYDFRSVRLYQVSIPVLVPFGQLQRIMPSGFTAIATPSGSQVGTVNFLYIIDQRFERTVTDQNHGPFSGVLLTTNMLNTTATPARQEILLPAFEVSGEVAALNAAFGPGSSRQARVTVETEEEEGQIKFNLDIKDAGIGFDVKASATAPLAINNRVKSDPVSLPFRPTNGFIPNTAFFAASQGDALTVPTASAAARFQTPDGQLHLPAGSLTILGLGQNITFSRLVEFLIKFQ